jgi:ribosome-associated protein
MAKIRERKTQNTKRKPSLAVGQTGTKISTSRALALFCADLIKEKKGLDIVILNVKKQLQITDYFVICSARNRKQSQAIAQHINSALRKNPCSGQGYEQGSWIVLDLVEVIVHIFLEPLRRHYDLEFLWSNVPRVRALNGAKDATPPSPKLSSRRRRH